MSSSIKMTHPTATTVEQVEMGAETGQDTTSTKNDTTATGNGQMRIADLLLTGEENATPLRHIKQMIDLPGREIRKQIQMERESHVPIVSGRHGYFLAANNMEKERFVRGMKRRAHEIVKVAEAVGKADLDG